MRSRLGAPMVPVAGGPKDASRHRSQLVKPGALSEPEVIVSASGRVKNHRSRSGRRLKVAMRSGEVSWEGCPRDKSAVSRAPIPPCSEVTVPCAVTAIDRYWVEQQHSQMMTSKGVKL
ncbi:hypothetical protein MLD38_010008 [Melastoma candidum]|uniref:Uncharacterized protein n=1 Tax=Melastoma candidum TaxID=119954 RepID=A0ACB9QYE6_9MYRT|nr:hypothetical protein MLD38_010008 [Melastoma candidum]